MITELYKLSIRMAKVFIFYMPRLPVQWSPDYRQLTLETSKCKFALYIATIFDMVFAIAGANIYVFITRTYFDMGTPLDADQLLLIAFGTTSIIFVQGQVVIFYRRFRVAIVGINSIFSLAEEMTRRYRPNEIDENGLYIPANGQDLIGMAACVVSFFFSLNPLVLTIFFLWYNIDPLDIALDDALPDKKYWGWSTTLLAFSIRFICCQITMGQGTQIIYHLCVIAGAVVLNLIHCMQILLNDIESEEEFLDLYIRFGLAFKLMKHLLDDILLTTLTTGYWGIAFAIWGCLTCYNKLSVMMYLPLVSGTGTSLVALGFLFRKLKQAIEMGDEMLENKRHQSRMKLADVKTRVMQRIAKRLNALTAVQLGFGSFYPLSTDYFMEFLNSLMAQVVDFIVMFK
ncbi:unnamed protein product [Orchesella dallaii]|uniref:Gustatory receptor n=1 Tax=Orchesella dallaii TaxID=48710 RepID=A0ABP1RUN3_9HEXA